MRNRIELYYDELSATEKNIADYFLQDGEKENLAAAYLAKKLHVSEASLSRFAQKLGYHGYREFVYGYRNEEQGRAKGKQHIGVLDCYEETLRMISRVTNKDAISYAAKLLAEKKRIYLYGLGSSGIAAEEMELRLLRIGADAKCMRDFHQMVINERQLNEQACVVGLSLSGKTKEITESLKKAAKSGAATILITANQSLSKEMLGVDEVLLTAGKSKTMLGNGISPQIPILLIWDMVYAEYVAAVGFDEQKDKQLWHSIKEYQF